MRPRAPPCWGDVAWWAADQAAPPVGCFLQSRVWELPAPPAT